MKVMLTGAAGQLGSDVAIAAATGAFDITALDSTALDIGDEEAVAAEVALHRPDVVINCAAFTAVDRCESEIEAAHRVNEHGVRFLAQACADTDAHLVHIGTDYVFDGTLDRPYREDDETNPQSVYGASKLAGERAALDVLGDAVTIARTSWVCGAHGANMVKTVLRLAANGTEMAFVDDQRGHPTFTSDLAGALLQLAHDRPGGVFHVTNAGPVSWFEFVQSVLSAAGHSTDMVRPISSDELDPPRPAPRPANSVLENAAWAAAGYAALRDFRAPLAEVVTRLQ